MRDEEKQKVKGRLRAIEDKLSQKKIVTPLKIVGWAEGSEAQQVALNPIKIRFRVVKARQLKSKLSFGSTKYKRVGVGLRNRSAPTYSLKPTYAAVIGKPTCQERVGRRANDLINI